MHETFGDAGFDMTNSHVVVDDSGNHQRSFGSSVLSSLSASSFKNSNENAYKESKAVGHIFSSARQQSTVLGRENEKGQQLPDNLTLLMNPVSSRKPRKEEKDNRPRYFKPNFHPPDFGHGLTHSWDISNCSGLPTKLKISVSEPSIVNTNLMNSQESGEKCYGKLRNDAFIEAKRLDLLYSGNADGFTGYTYDAPPVKIHQGKYDPHWSRMAGDRNHFFEGLRKKKPMESAVSRTEDGEYFYEFYPVNLTDELSQHMHKTKDFNDFEIALVVYGPLKPKKPMYFKKRVEYSKGKEGVYAKSRLLQSTNLTKQKRNMGTKDKAVYDRSNSYKVLRENMKRLNVGRKASNTSEATMFSEQIVPSEVISVGNNNSYLPFSKSDTVRQARAPEDGNIGNRINISSPSIIKGASKRRDFGMEGDARDSSCNRSSECSRYYVEAPVHQNSFESAELYGYSRLRISEETLSERFKKIFRRFASTSRYSGEVISRKISTDWMTRVGITGDIISEADADEAFKLAAGTKITMNIEEYKAFLIMLSLKKKLPCYLLYRRMCYI